MTESQIQASIKKALEDLGFVVQSTSINQMGRLKQISRGTPDLLVSVGPGIWAGLEVKTPKTIKKLTPEQAKFLEEGRICVVDSVESAINSLYWVMPLNMSKPWYTLNRNLTNAFKAGWCSNG